MAIAAFDNPFLSTGSSDSVLEFFSFDFSVVVFFLRSQYKPIFNQILAQKHYLV